MKIFFLVVFLLINFSALSQKKLDGTYKTLPEHQRYTFLKNGTFEFSEGDDLYSIKGKGNYIIKKNKLKLKFTGYELLKNSFKIEERNCESSAFKGPIIHIRNKETKRGIPYAFINLSLKYSKKSIGNYEANNQGVFSGTGNIFEKYRDSSIIAIASYWNYDSLTFEFKLKPCKNIQIELVEGLHSHNRKISDGTVREYTIKTFTEKFSGLKGIILNSDTSLIHPGGYNTTLYKRKEKD